jgi:hypothetical protein
MAMPVKYGISAADNVQRVGRADCDASYDPTIDENLFPRETPNKTPDAVKCFDWVPADLVQHIKCSTLIPNYLRGHDPRRRVGPRRFSQRQDVNEFKPRESQPRAVFEEHPLLRAHSTQDKSL